MFDRIKKAFSKEGARKEAGSSSAFPASSQLAGGELSEWASTQGWAYAERGQGRGHSLEGAVGGRPWRLEVGRPSRDFIRQQELRARAELGLPEEVAVLLMNRPLKETLEKRAYQLFTDNLRTTADPNLPEEMRWLAMYPEVGWDSIGTGFWQRYAVLAEERDHAEHWLNGALADLLLHWPDPAPDAQVPFMLMLLRGKAYLRMEYTSGDMATLQHATAVFTAACESALGGLATDLAL